MSTECFRPNGSKYDTVIPCNANAVENGEHSACCAFNDLCLTNGMCRNQNDDEHHYNYYWREGCTDSTFEDPACPQYCMSSEDDRSADHLIIHCLAPDSTNWACAPPGVFATVSGIMTDGCNEPSYTFSALAPLIYTTALLATIPRSITRTGSSLSSVSQASGAASHTISITTDTTTTPAITASPPSRSTPLLSKSSSGLSSGAKVGLGVGISLGVVLVALVGVIITLLRRWKTAHTGGREAQEENVYVKPEFFTRNKPQATPLHELESRRKPAELAASAE